MDEGGKFYGADKFNPRLISTQIVVMQSTFYFCFTLVSAMTNWLLSFPQSLSALFDYSAYTWSTSIGLALAFSELVTALLMAVACRVVVERVRKCLDFVATYHILHLVAICWWSGFPTTLQWWTINGVSLLVAVLLGEWLCMQGESKSIKLGAKSKRKPCLDA
eukprot:TRINITY_DN114782_c0_g1_i1.p1 TRINITY_DN114782_c0_g1~~TRINITY_DN114782_c0_g1_i1.p1  ORF type:complete len:163 (+),score=12.94 TRINITY_DN114782_c0_g1_i1:80-568(+)